MCFLLQQSKQQKIKSTCEEEVVQEKISDKIDDETLENVELDNQGQNLKKASSPEIGAKTPLRYRRNELSLTDLNLNIPIILISELGKPEEFIARGGQALVWRGKFRGTDVAMKVFEQNCNSFMAFREIKLLTRIRHPNIVSIIAVSEGYTNITIVMEFFDSFNLKQVIFGIGIKNDYCLNLTQKNHIAKQLCLALNFLHLEDEPIVHRDVKPENVLVEKTKEYRVVYNIKLCDLGMSRCDDLMSELQSSIDSSKPKGTEFYSPPELIRRETPCPKSDVWSMACTLLELYTERETWNFAKSDIQKNHVAEAFSKGKSPCIMGAPNFIRNTLLQCFDHDRLKRPTVANVLQLIENELE